MNIQTQKLSIIESLINIDDNKALKKVKGVIAEYSKSKPVKKTKSITLEEFYSRIDASEKAHHEGKIISSKQLREEMKSWGKK